MKILQELFLEVGEPVIVPAYLTLFLPGMHFWTVAIGKDAPLFLAIALALWASMNIRRRYLALGFSVAVMLLFRPHVALLTMIALAAAAFFDTNTKWYLRLAMVGGAAVAAAIVLPDLQTTYRLDMTNADSVADFISERSNVTEESGGDALLMNASLPFKVVSLWLRPFFFDADAVLAYAASMENSVILAIFLIFGFNVRTMWRLFRKILYVRFSVFLFIGITLMVASINYNIGLGLRQKMMAMPALLTMLYTLIAVRAARRRLLVPAYVAGYNQMQPARYVPPRMVVAQPPRI